MKKETLEKAAEGFYEENTPNITFLMMAQFGAEFQAERMYSEEDLREAYMVGKHGGTTQAYYEFKEWFEQFKKK